MATGTPKLEWDEGNLKKVTDALTAFRGVLEEQRTIISTYLENIGDPGSLESAQNTKSNLILDAEAIKGKLAQYIAYLDNAKAQVNGDVQFLLTR